jgi:hypothetical protein
MVKYTYGLTIWTKEMLDTIEPLVDMSECAAPDDKYVYMAHMMREAKRLGLITVCEFNTINHEVANAL